jgi:hypothetical protein
MRPSVGTRQVVGDKLKISRCNHCRTPVLNEHRALHAFECRQRRNRQKLGAMNLEKDGKPLYAVAITRKRRGKWRAPEILYAHADNSAEAKRFAVSGETDPIHVIETGLAVGWFEQEKTGLITG